MHSTRHIGSILAAMLLALALCACCGCTPSSEDVIRRTVVQELNAYKNLDDSVMSKLSTSAAEEGLDELGITGEDFASAVVEGFEFSIDSVEVEGSTASVDVSIASKSSTDFESRLDAAITEFLDASGTDTLSTEEKNAKVGEIAMKAFKETKVVNEDVTFDFRLEDTTWKCTNAADALGKLDSLVFSS